MNSAPIATVPAARAPGTQSEQFIGGMPLPGRFFDAFLPARTPAENGGRRDAENHKDRLSTQR